MRVLFGPTTVTTAGTRVQLSNTEDRIKWIRFASRVSNTGRIFVGNSSVSSTASGWEMTSSEATIAKGGLELDFRPGSELMSNFYADAIVSGEIIDWVAIVE